jgi:MFS family permease
MTALVQSPRRYGDGSVIGLVSIAHYSSHVLQLTLPPLFPVLHLVFGVSFTELGLVAALFFGASGLGQLCAGIAVDRFGGLPVLLTGMVAISIATLLAGLVASYWMLLPLAILAGLGNSVFHPADLSILSHRVSASRLGRAFAGHAFSGALGYVTTPLVVTAIAASFGWRLAPIACGLFGLAVTGVVFWNRAGLVYERSTAHAVDASGNKRHFSFLSTFASPVVMLAFCYFAFTAFAGSGIQTFSIATLTAGFGLSLDFATYALTVYLAGLAAGIALGGILADHTQAHHRVAMAGVGFACACMLAIALGHGSGAVVMPAMLGAGVAYGITGPSRDVLVRRAAQGSGLGTVFGFVYSGFDLGSSLAPLVFGVIVDHKAPHLVFLTAALFYAFAVPTVMQVRRSLAEPARGVAD